MTKRIQYYGRDNNEHALLTFKSYCCDRLQKMKVEEVASPDSTKKKTYPLYLWVLVAIIMGAIFGFLDAKHAINLKLLGDGFVNLIKMLIAPIIFFTVVLGIAGTSSLRKVGRVGGKALIYFEVVSTLALILGLFVVNTMKPGSGFHVDPASLDAKAVANYATKAGEQSFQDFVLHIIPKNFIGAFTSEGSLLQVLLLAALFGFAIQKMGRTGKFILKFIEKCAAAFFHMMNAVMKLAPVGAFGAMAFTIGKYGTSALGPLALLMGSFYLTCALFIVCVLGTIAMLMRFNIFKFLIYIKEELLTVLGTSSSESALIPLMRKLEKLGCSRSVTGLVLPAGYSFNLDGTNIYLAMAALFIAQAMDIDLTLTQQVTLLGVAMLTSKGASGVTGAGFVTLAATLAVIPSLPVAGLALILGIDRFMSEARSITNFIGNGVATIVVSRWENELNHEQLKTELGRSLNKKETLIEKIPEDMDF